MPVASATANHLKCLSIFYAIVSKQGILKQNKEKIVKFKMILNRWQYLFPC
jgi:hypothetical protein